MYQMKKFEECMGLLLIIDGNKSHYVYIKGFNRFMCNNTKHKNKKHFFRYCSLCFSSEKALVNHKEVCLKINDKPSVKLRSGSIKFNNYSKKLATEVESVLKKVQRVNKDSSTSYTEKHQDNIPCSFD